MGTNYRNSPTVIVKRLTLNESTSKFFLSAVANEFSKGNIDLRTLNALTFDSVQLSKKISEAKKICERMEKTLNGGEKNGK